MSSSGPSIESHIEGYSLSIHRWAIGRPAVVASMAQQMATSVPMMQELIQLIRSGHAARVVHKDFGTTDWLYLYRKPELLEKVLLREFQCDIDLRPYAMIQSFFAERLPNMGQINLEILDNAPPEVLAQAEEMVRQLGLWFYQHSLAEIAASMRDDDPGVSPIIQSMDLPELQFFTLVVLPCLLEYGQYPHELYRRARGGDMQSLYDLLRVDKSIIGDPDLGPMINRAGMESEEFIAQGLADAFRGRPRTKQEAGTIKARIAAYMVKFSERAGCKLDPKEIRHLFDAVEKDRTGDPNAVDTDLPEYDEAWRQRVHNAKPFMVNRLKREYFSISERYAHFVLDAVVSEQDEPAPEPTWIDPYRLDDVKEARDRAKRGPKPSILRRLVNSLFGR